MSKSFYGGQQQRANWPQHRRERQLSELVAALGHLNTRARNRHQHHNDQMIGREEGGEQ